MNIVHSTVPYTLERAPWVLFSFLPERVGGLSRVGALSNVPNNVKIWALFLSESSGVGALSRVGGLSRLGPLSSVYGNLVCCNCCHYHTAVIQIVYIAEIATVLDRVPVGPLTCLRGPWTVTTCYSLSY